MTVACASAQYILNIPNPSSPRVLAGNCKVCAGRTHEHSKSRRHSRHWRAILFYYTRGLHSWGIIEGNDAQGRNSPNLFGLGDSDLDFDSGVNADGGDLTHDLAGGVQVDQALVDAHLEAVPGVGTYRMCEEAWFLHHARVPQLYFSGIPCIVHNVGVFVFGNHTFTAGRLAGGDAQGLGGEADLHRIVCQEFRSCDCCCDIWHSLFPCEVYLSLSRKTYGVHKLLHSNPAFLNLLISANSTPHSAWIAFISMPIGSLNIPFSSLPSNTILSALRYQHW